MSDKDPEYDKLLQRRRAFNDMLSKIDTGALRAEFNETAKKDIDALETKLVDWALEEAASVKGKNIDLIGGLNILGRMMSDAEMNRLDSEGDRMVLEISQAHFEAVRTVVDAKKDAAHPVLRELARRLDALSEREYNSYYATAKALQGLDEIGGGDAKAAPRTQPKP